MKIAIVTTNFPRWEGDFRVPFIIDAARAIQSKGHYVRIITPHQPGSKQKEIFEGMEVFRAKYLPEKAEVLQKDTAGLPAAWQRGLGYKLAMIPYIAALTCAVARQANGCDIIHANFSLAGFASAVTRPLHHLPYIVTVHGSDIFKTVNKPLLKIPVETALKHAGHIIAVSQALAEGAESVGISPDKIQVIPTGIDINKFPVGAPESRKDTLIYVGSLIKRKSVITLLQAMEKLRDPYPTLQLQIVGEGDLRQSLEDYTNQHDLQNRVQFLGTQSQAEVARLMREAKLFILPSTEEGQGAVLVEAMASGTPCIGSRAGGIPTVITPETGLTFEPGNSDQLIQAVTTMLEDETFWQNAALCGRERAKAHYDWNVLADSIIAIYNKVL
jgi:glycosyltransferase involved in cell wall biosynthesis